MFSLSYQKTYQFINTDILYYELSQLREYHLFEFFKLNKHEK